MKGPRLSELSPTLRAAALVLAVVQISLYLAAYLDLARRPAQLVRGSKTRWRLICLLNTVGPLSYLRWGRLPENGETARDGGATAASAGA
jgi:hypothetical protein